MLTITTVGFGVHYLVTTGGRITARIIMITGVGIIGALASILSSLLVGSSSAPVAEDSLQPATTPPVEEQLENVKNELAALQQLVEGIAAEIKSR